jgi:hypothetical protein
MNCYLLFLLVKTLTKIACRLHATQPRRGNIAGAILTSGSIES